MGTVPDGSGKQEDEKTIQHEEGIVKAKESKAASDEESGVKRLSAMTSRD